MLRSTKLFRHLVVAASFIAVGCTNSLPVDDLFTETLNSAENKGRPSNFGQSRQNTQIRNSNQNQAFRGAVQVGSGSFVSQRAPRIESGKTRSGSEGFKVNLVAAPISEAAKLILSDIAGLSYVIDPRVTGTITLQTSNPVSKNDILEIFETTLTINNAGLVKRGDQYQVVPLNEAILASPSISVPSVAPKGPGIQVQVVELQHISAEEMSVVLKPISREGSILRADSERNHLILAGTRSDLSAMRDAISVFDVDWMRGMSVALHPLKSSQPSEVAKELDTIFKTKNGPGKGIVRFVPNNRLNSILVISSRPNYLQRAAAWIARLDRVGNSNEKQLFVYQIQNRAAQELASVLQSVLNADDPSVADRNGTQASLAPNVQPARITTNNPISEQVEVTREPLTDQPVSQVVNASNVSIVADVDNNALLIQTTPKEYQRIERIVQQLDILPTQVLLEAIIAEVTLNDELEFGVRWAIENGNFNFGLSDLVSGFAGAQFPGFNFGFATNDVQITLNALSSITDVNVISSPTLTALNNQQAVLQVGDQVPIITQQATGVGAANAPIVNSVELRDTGIILKVVPRVNASGRVMLDVEQEVSSVVNTTTSGIDSP
ncbi:MAG: secretin N-terminal domain-containing protein, partial [Chloroflexota bacterium]